MKMDYDKIIQILDDVKCKAKQTYNNDSFAKNIIEDIFWDIDILLISYEQNYKIDKKLLAGVQ
jgi:hypothetical protein